MTQAATDESGIPVAQVTWPIADGERSSALELAHVPKVGDQTSIWIDQDGDLVPPPTPTWQAGVDAFAAALAILLVVGVAVLALVMNTRSWLDRSRSAEWDRELRCLQEDGGPNFRLTTNAPMRCAPDGTDDMSMAG
ncbi:hypothetical protein [Mycobacterium tilburgii]|uniref:hypothetical protein n=1 Tax=Mycobacterium tilburgii TaxID=44467 RepID=UPI00118273F0|nr:hypothetical protein [Mycobacterium tilburgii]